MKIHIIYLENDMLLSKAEYSDWKQIQDQFQEYKASLGPWDSEEIIEYLSEEYPEMYAEKQDEITTYLNNNIKELVL